MVHLNSDKSKGIGFTRYAIALALNNGSFLRASQHAEQTWRDTPSVAACLKAAIDGGSNEAGNWAEALYHYGLAQDFIGAARQAEVISRLPGVRSAPFDILVPRETSGGSGAWVSPGAPTPMARSTFDRVALPRYACAVVQAFDRDLLKIASPAIERSVRDSLIAGVVETIDETFCGGDAAVTDLSPAGIRYGASEITQTGTNAAALSSDLRNMIDAVTTSLVSPVWIMRKRTWAYAQYTLGYSVAAPNQQLFGFPVITSNAMTILPGSPTTTDAHVILLDAASLMVADEGRASVTGSTHAQLQMSDSPTDGAATGVSMFQTHSAAVHVRREINWQLGHSGAVSWMRTSL